MRRAVFVFIAWAALAGDATAQGFQGTPTARIKLAQAMQAESSSAKVPDYGYVVYDQSGKVLKAYGPETPVVDAPGGMLAIKGVDLPPGASVRTEDGLTYMAAFATLADKTPDKSEYAEAMEELVRAVGDGATYIKENLCTHPARPSTMKVEIAGGFSFGVYGSMTSTVDWDLEKLCSLPEASALTPGAPTAAKGPEVK